LGWFSGEGSVCKLVGGRSGKRGNKLDCTKGTKGGILYKITKNMAKMGEREHTVYAKEKRSITGPGTLKNRGQKEKEREARKKKGNQNWPLPA